MYKSSTRLRYTITTLLIAAAYAASAMLGMRFWSVQQNVTLIWPPTGISLALVLVLGYRTLPGIALGAFTVNLVTGGPWLFALATAIGNPLEAAVGAYLLKRVVGFHPSMDRVRDVLGLVGLAAGVGTIISATCGVIGLGLTRGIPWTSFARIWFEWWLGDATGALILTPVLLTWSTPSTLRWTRASLVEAIALAMILGVTTQLAFTDFLVGSVARAPLGHVPLVLLLYAAFRFGQRGATASVLIVSGIAVAATARGHGMFVVGSQYLNLVFLLSFILTCAVAAMLLAAVLEERARTRQSLSESEDQYRTLFEASGDAVFLISMDIADSGKILSANPAAAAMHGYSIDELLTLNIRDLDTLDSAAQVPARMDEIRRGGRLRFEVEHRRKDGSTFPLEVHACTVHVTGRQRILALDRDITDLKRSQQALRASEERYRLLFEQNLTGVFYSMPDGGHVECNDAFVRLFGFDSKEDLVSHPVTDLYPSPAHREAYLTRLRDEGELTNFEITLRRKDGSLFEAMENVILLRDADGREYIHGTILDITDRKRAESALRDEHNLLRGIIDGTDDEICVKDPDGRYVLMNEADARSFGRRIDELIGITDRDLFPPQDAQRIRELDLNVLQTGARLEYDQEFPMYDGSRRMYAVRKFPRHDAQGRVIGVIAIGRDVTEQKRAEAALRESESRLRAIWDAEPECVKLVARDGTLSDMNPAGLEMVEARSRDEVIGKSVLSLVAPEYVAAYRGLIADVFQGHTRELSFETNGASGVRRWMETHAVPLRDAAGTVTALLAVTRDVTARKLAEENLRQRERELAHVARVSMMGETASGLAHELNQPLTAAANYAQGAIRRLRAGSAAPEDLLKPLEAMTEQAHRAAAIIRAFGQFVQKREPRHGRLSVNLVVRDAIGLSASEVRTHRSAIKMELTLDEPIVFADNVQIQQVLLNLVRNGLEAMDSSSSAGSQERILSVRTAVVGRDVHIAVTDRGPGLDSSLGERVFEPFFTTKADGMGMGLSISRSIVDAHGGKLWAHPNQEGGATFEFSLPLFRGSAEDEP